MRLWVSLILCLVASAAELAAAAPLCSTALFSTLDTQEENQVQTYLQATLHSLETMRGENGLVKDAVFIGTQPDNSVAIKTLNDITSPTNIAVDLLIQSEMALRPKESSHALGNLNQVITTLEKAAYHQDTGLFFSRYTTHAGTDVKDYAVSSIDNMHLALALWTVKETFPQSSLGKRAAKLFDRMNFSVYLNEDRGVIGGNLKYENGTWTKEAYNFDDLGSEARSLYGAGWALGLFRDIKDDSGFPAKSLSSVRAEIYPSAQGNILRLWDGSAFQLYFPKMFINEEAYSKSMNDFYRSEGNYMLAEGQRRRLPAPAAHSAGWASLSADGISKRKSSYRDKAGNIQVVSSINGDVREGHLRKDWDATFTPYALFMAGTAAPEKFLPTFASLQNLQSKRGPLYSAQMGWMDGLQVKGSAKGQVIPVQLSLNQGMLALALLQMQAPDGMSLSSRQMFKDPRVHERLQYFYQLFDQKINTLQNGLNSESSSAPKANTGSEH